MKNCAGNRSEGALRPQNRVFWAHFSIFWPYRAKIRRKSKNLNKGLLGTTHKLSHCDGFRSLQSLFLQPVGRPQSPDVGTKKMKRIAISIVVLAFISGCGYIGDLLNIDFLRTWNCDAALKQAERKAKIDRVDGQWALGDGLPSVLGYMIAKVAPLDENEATQLAYDIALTIVGDDHFLSLSSVAVTSKVCTNGVGWKEDGQWKSSTYVSTDHFAKVTLESKSPRMPWNMTVHFEGGGVSKFECTPPVINNSAQYESFWPSAYRKAWQNPRGTNDAERIGRQVTEIFAGIWPTQDVQARFESQINEWVVDVMGYGQPGPWTRVRISENGSILSFDWVPRE